MTRPSPKQSKGRDPKCKRLPPDRNLNIHADLFDRGENGRIDGRTAAAKAMGYNPAVHKLGPKANQGVINEKLRALDRTGKPCRRWQKTGFKLKSFTGKVWEVPTWRTPQVRSFGETADSRDGSSNDLSKENSSSNIGSDKSPAVENPDVVSSPIRIAPAPS